MRGVGLTIAMVTALGLSLGACSTGESGSHSIGGGAAGPSPTTRPASTVLVLVARATVDEPRGLERDNVGTGAPCRPDPVTAIAPISSLVTGREVTMVDLAGKVIARSTLPPGSAAKATPAEYFCIWKVPFSPGPPDGVYDVQVDGVSVGIYDTTATRKFVDLTGDVVANLPKVNGATP